MFLRFSLERRISSLLQLKLLKAPGVPAYFGQMIINPLALINVPKNEYHTSSPVYKRKSGLNSMEFPAREPSKKQLKKKARFVEAAKEKRNPSKEKNRQNAIQTQLQSKTLKSDFEKFQRA